MHVFPLYAALLAIFFVGLSIRTLRLRRRLRVAIGDAAHPLLTRAIRAHANFAEYVPLSLILLATLELQGAASWAMHALGAMLLLGRIAHAYGVSQVDENFRFRIAGMALTYTVMVIAACALLIGLIGSITR